MNERCPESIIYQDESQTLEGAVSCRFVVAQIVLCHSHKQISAPGQARVGAARVMASAHRTPNSLCKTSHCSKHWSILNCDKHWHCYTPSPCIATASNCQHSQIQGPSLRSMKCSFETRTSRTVRAHCARTHWSSILQVDKSFLIE